MLTSCGLRTETTISCPFFLAVPQCEAPCFKLVLLKENVISSVLWQRGRTVFTCRNPREEKKKKETRSHCDVGTAGVLLCTNCVRPCWSSFLGRAWPRQAGCGSGLSGRALSCSSSNPDLQGCGHVSQSLTFCGLSEALLGRLYSSHMSFLLCKQVFSFAVPAPRIPLQAQSPRLWRDIVGLKCETFF